MMIRPTHCSSSALPHHTDSLGMSRKMLGIFAALLAVSSLTLPAIAGKVHLTPPQIGEPAPAFELNDVSTGETVKLSDFEGKTVVVVFQSINCPWDKMRESGGYQRMLSPLAQEYADQDVVFLAINSNKNESVEEVASYHAQHDMPYPILKDPGNKIADAYAAMTTPHTFVIDREGILRYRGGIEITPLSPEHCGEMDEQYLEPVLGALLNGEELPVTVTKSKGCSIKRQ